MFDIHKRLHERRLPLTPAKAKTKTKTITKLWQQDRRVLAELAACKANGKPTHTELDKLRTATRVILKIPGGEFAAPASAPAPAPAPAHSLSEEQLAVAQAGAVELIKSLLRW
ncbi:hypothetical protein GQX73_g9676 [Xylaria multiplex]|uniref:Uncharacterized protein n=1 Tax=Xylaria multiplex TaxID=323545 RepID=A0A7C8IHM4_9PEZI|nr:hypothetical protein GQX73_g9676 [Xylaria multiplex]